MTPIVFERLDPLARAVMQASYEYAVQFGDQAIGTEHLLLALATIGSPAADLLGAAGCNADDLRDAVAARPARAQRRDHAALLAAFGIDLDAVRVRAEQSFGVEAVDRAARRARRSRPRRSRWSRISCSTPQPTLRCVSPLTNQLGITPRVKRLLERATRSARPELATPTHLLHELVNGNEPAGEVLVARGIDLAALAADTARVLGIRKPGHGRRADNQPS